MRLSGVGAFLTEEEDNNVQTRADLFGISVNYIHCINRYTYGGTGRG